jgi:DNA polymerase-3 subunit delta'
VNEAAPQREADQIAGVEPPEFSPGLHGHDAAMTALHSQISGGRLPSGIMVHGPLGIGKATLAFRLARDIFTATGDEEAHRVDEQIRAGAHPNLFVLRKAPRDTKGFYTAIRVEEVRALRDRLHHTRGRAGHRVAIVDAIDDANASAANALLKILEEPPPDTVFLLISHRPGGLLPTIRSRCHQVALRPLADAHVRAVLTEGGGDPTRIGDAVALAEGRPRRGFEALQLADGAAIAALRNWLADPASAPMGSQIALADALGMERDGAAARFARDLVRERIAAEARAAAMAGPGARSRLASAAELWEKATSLFADADSLNLDFRQTLVAVFDAMRTHFSRSAAESR